MPVPQGSEHGGPAAGASFPARRQLVVAAVAGLLSFLACLLPEAFGGVGTNWGAGVIFGALALAPQGRSWARRTGLFLASVLVYRGAVWVAVALAAERHWPEIAACALAGVVAAPLLAAGAQLLLARRPRLTSHVLGLIAGAVGGALIGFAASGPDDQILRFHLPLLAGFVVWQVGWAAAYGPRSAGPTR